MAPKKTEPPQSKTDVEVSKQNVESDLKKPPKDPEEAFIQKLIEIEIDHVEKFKDKLIEMLKMKPKQSVKVKDVFPKFRKGSDEHKFLSSLNKKDIARPQGGGGQWTDNRNIILTATGVDIAIECGLPVQPFVFVSYSHKDRDWKNRVDEHLSVLKQTFVVELWSDKKIGIGEKWGWEIDDALMRAKAFVLLISSSFFNSEFIRDKEIPSIRDKLLKEKFVFPILVRPCAWEAVDWLKELQIRPEDGRALSTGNEAYIDSKLAEITIEIYKKFLEQPSADNAKA